MNFYILFVVFWLIDLYVFTPFKKAFNIKSRFWRLALYTLYWVLPLLTAISFVLYNNTTDWDASRYLRYIMMTLVSLNYIPKIFIVLFLLISDAITSFRYSYRYITRKRGSDKLPGSPISRSRFISRSALIAGAAPLALMGFGIAKGAHDYRVFRRTIYLPNLPRQFDGITIGQISDIHSGSFFNKTAVRGGVEMFMREKPDMVFFTGDLVNNRTDEANDYIDIFNKIKAPLGVFSVTGNHDYGDYQRWPSREAKKRNFDDFLQVHKSLGYDLLMNENRFIEIGGQKIAIIGIENWGAGRFQKYGDLALAHQGTEEAEVKLLLSHDPSHWDAQVLPGYKDIDVSFAGHTHGFQFGVEIGNFRWSPSQYIYKQWADLYEHNGQYIYVNRGYGFIGYPGRIGIAPEVTIIELKKG